MDPRDRDGGSDRDGGRKRIPKPIEAPRTARGSLVAATGADGRTRHVVTVGEKLVERAPTSVVVGSTVIIVSGEHKGLAGTVRAILPTEQYVVRLRINESVRFLLLLVAGS